MQKKSTIDEKEIKHFALDSDKWWDEDGAFAPLHKLNPARISYIKSIICKKFGLDTQSFDALRNINIIDVGCGGGLVCEPLSRMGAIVTGIDADSNAIKVAKQHGKMLDINYLNSSIEEVKGQYDVVLALEIIEHVADIDLFIKECSRLCNDNGIIIFSTMNRTLKSLGLGIIAAEYIMRWVPKGTHDWKKFVKPSELAKYVRKYGMDVSDICGLVYNPFEDDFRLDKVDIDVNYFMTVSKNL